MTGITHLDPADPDDVTAADRLLHMLYPGADHRFDPALLTGGVHTLLARDRESAVGLATVTFVHDGWEPYGLIEQLVVQPDERRRGVGRVLARAACDLLADLGAVVVFVTVDPDAEGFYRRVGFDSAGLWLGWTPK
jgi:GNAT superfamily N-acetyltransferase